MNLSIACAPPAPAEQADQHCLARLRLQAQPSEEPWMLPLPVLTASVLDETWLLDETVTASSVSAQGWDLQHRYAGHLAMSWLQFDLGGHADTAAATRWAYHELLNHLATSNHQQLLKIWHYLPGINVGEGDEETYRQFCVGRAQALRDQHITATMPAATAIGIPRSAASAVSDSHTPQQAANEELPAAQRAVFYWLSGTLAPANVENPRQVSAWQYPPQYGPASPLFSRASVLRLGTQRLLLISGTASVTGHATAYPGDCAAQTGEMLRNLRSLVVAADMPYAPEKMLLRVYLRHPEDWSLVRTLMQQAGFNDTRLVPLHGDICRSDLLVELDGVLLQDHAVADSA